MEIYLAGKKKLNKPRFTLIEVIVVLVLISLICAIVIPRIGIIPDGVVRKENERQIRASFLMAKQLSRSKSEKVVLYIDPKTKQIYIPDEDNQEIFKRLLSVNLDKRCEIQAMNGQNQDRYEYIFYPDGEASGPDLLLKYDKLELNLSVNEITAKAQIVYVD